MASSSSAAAQGGAPAQSQSQSQSANTPSQVPQLDVEVEADNSDADSSLGDDMQSFTTSLKSTVLNYRYENGRRYHAFADDDGKYMFPNDDDENDRLDLYHHIETLALGGKLHLAPIGNEPGRILDLGTGTGIWAIDMGDQYPTADILGNDISPIQPSIVPPNVRFEVDDIEQEWVYGQKFDFIHARYLACSLKNWPHLMHQAYTHTRPGGWVEFQDFDLSFYTSTDGSYTPQSAVAVWARTICNAVSKFGVEHSPGPKLEAWVKEAGFVNVVARVFAMPMGTWPRDKTLKEIGMFNLVSVLDNLEGMTTKVLQAGMGWSVDEVKVLCADTRAGLKDKSARMQHNFYVVYGQKPLDAAD